MLANGLDSKPKLFTDLGRTLPQFVAQSGNAAEFPENTLPALRSALEFGIKHIEFDVQLTGDGVPVVLRDTSLQRVANLDRNIFDLRADDLAQVHVNQSSRFGERFLDVGIPTLAQAAELLAAHPTALAFIDIQPASLRRFGNENVISAICDNLRQVTGQVVLITSDLPTIEFVRRRKNYLTGWILPDYSRLTALKCEAIAPDFLFCNHAHVPKENTRLWRGPWHWAISDVASLSQTLVSAEQGADFIATPEVRLLSRELRRHIQHAATAKPTAI